MESRVPAVNHGRMTTPGSAGPELRDLYLQAAAVSADLCAHPAVAAAWDKPSVLADFDVADLTAHLARQLLQVQWMLEDADPAAAGTVTAQQYYGDLQGTAELDSDLNVGVRARAREVSAAGFEATAELAAQSLQLLRGRLPGAAATRQVDAWGRPMTIDEYLRTRHVEISCHVEDLALSVGVPIPELPQGVLDDAIGVLLGAAIRRHGRDGVLRAMTRRERDHVQALRLL
jgi:hypothetical protein